MKPFRQIHALPVTILCKLNPCDRTWSEDRSSPPPTASHSFSKDLSHAPENMPKGFFNVTVEPKWVAGGHFCWPWNSRGLWQRYPGNLQKNKVGCATDSLFVLGYRVKQTRCLHPVIVLPGWFYSRVEDRHRQGTAKGGVRIRIRVRVG